MPSPSSPWTSRSEPSCSLSSTPPRPPRPSGPCWCWRPWEGRASSPRSSRGVPGPLPRRSAARPPDRPALAYLAAITVEGFRGVGPPATLELPPGPGLTLVVGRNGSGKSSFAEALEVALTGETFRWQARSAVWREAWRNLHHPAAQVRARFLLEGERGPCTVAAPVGRGRPARRRGDGRADPRQAPDHARRAGLVGGPPDPPAAPLLRRAGRAARREAVRALRRHGVDAGARRPGRRAACAPGGPAQPREEAQGGAREPGPAPGSPSRGRR